MLQSKEVLDAIHREAESKKLQDMIENKKHILRQIENMKLIQQEAHEEYLREREQVDNAIHRMIEEDREMARIQNLKMNQSQADMILSQNEKRALIRRQKEMDEYENEMVRRYAEQ